MGDAGAERGAIEERGRQNVQRVEPAARLTDVLDDEVARVVVLEPLLVLERVVHLREGHRAGLEPAVEHVGDATHRRLASRVVRVRARELINERTVEVRDLHAEVGLELSDGTVDVGARVGGIVRDPHGDRRAPEAVTRDRPVAGALQPLAEDAVLGVRGGPGDLLVELHHAVADLGHADEPRGHSLVHEGLAAAPAVRVGVHVGLLAHQHGADLGGAARDGATLLAQVGDHVAVRVEDLHALVVGYLGREDATLVDGHDEANAVLHARPHIVFTECGSLVDEAGTVRGRHVVGGDDGPAVGAGGAAFGAALGGVEVVVDRVVVDAHQLMALVGRDDGGVLAEFLGVGGDQVGGDEDALAGEVTLVVGGDLDKRVLDLRAHGDGRVRGQRPGRGRPDERQLGARRVLTQFGFQTQANRHRVVGAVLVHVVVHLELVIAQRRAIVPAVGQDAVTLVGQALVVELLESPQHGLGVGHVERLVVVLEVHPTGLAGDVLFPFLRVAQHGGTAGSVERLDTDTTFTGDLGDILDAELALGLELGGQAVRVPAETALDAVTLHGLVAAHHVLDVAGQEVTVVGQAVGERRAIVEHELVGAMLAGVTHLNGLAEGVVAGPERQGALFHRGEGRAGVHLVLPVAGVEAVLRHECPRLAPIQGRGPASPAPAVPPRLPLPHWARPLRWGCVGPSRPVLLEGTRPWPAVAFLFLPDAPR